MNTVIVLMSTYNGEKYIVEQIESIMRQKDVCVRLYIRDDGSTDKTIDLIQQMKEIHKEQLFWIKGENIGYRRSFLRLLEECGTADYYAFSDQDDIWDEIKLHKAIEKIESRNENEPILYASGLLLTDENLQNQLLKSINESRTNLKANFLRGTLAGCTFVFNDLLAGKVKMICTDHLPEQSMPSHDFLVSSLAFSVGEVIVDNQSYILHRRHATSWGADGHMWLKRLKVECHNMFYRKNVASLVAKAILSLFSDELKTENRDFLESVAHNTDSIKSKWKLICYQGFSVKNLLLDAETYLKILIGRY